FLADYPPGSEAGVLGASPLPPNGPPTPILPELQLFCGCYGNDPSRCSGRVRGSSPLFPRGGPRDDFLFCFTCLKCLREVKTYAVRFTSVAQWEGHITLSYVEKFGEWPPFAPRTSNKLSSLIGPARDLFMKGRRAESEGLGLGAFAYYRRLVEDQKARLLNEIIAVSRRLNASPETISQLERAKTETQFSRAVGSVKDAIPQSLSVKGIIPLTLLHGALSRGPHSKSDEECLRLAHSMRLILAEFADRCAQVTKDDKELTDALAVLLKE